MRHIGAMAAQLETEAVPARRRSGGRAAYIIYYVAGGTPADIPLAPLCAARTCGRRDRTTSARGPRPVSLVSEPLARP